MTTEWMVQVPPIWNGDVVVEPANRGRSEFLVLLRGGQDWTGGNSEPAVITFAWDSATCDCGDLPLRLKNATSSAGQAEYRLHFRVDRRTSVFSSDCALGRHPEPYRQPGLIRDRWTAPGEEWTAGVDLDDRGHLTVSSVEMLRPGRLYELKYSGSGGGGSEHLVDLFESVVGWVSGAEWHSGFGLDRRPKRVVIAAVSQAARAVNRAVACGLLWRIGDALPVITYGAGSRTIPRKGEGSTHDGEWPSVLSDEMLSGIASFTTAGEFAGGFESSVPGSAYLAGIPHGDSTAVVPVAPGSWGRVRLSGLRSPDRGIVFRALYKSVQLDDPCPPLHGKGHRVTPPAANSLRRLLGSRLVSPHGRALVAPSCDLSMNEILGIRPLEVRVPVASYYGAAVFPQFDGTTEGIPGIHYVIPLGTSDDGWGRPLLSDLYRNRADYLAKVEHVAARMVRDGELLEEDVAVAMERCSQNFDIAAGGPSSDDHDANRS
ncbi:alpha/beta hydrolase domain-containing protein [Gordonia rubripertincta]|uniref:alpha/beta hydrolase domain-containing protein n=1 Tax=Gordonia rubripertincta TaxID=36822 RepID=UPI0036F4722C